MVDLTIITLMVQVLEDLVDLLVVLVVEILTLQMHKQHNQEQIQVHLLQIMVRKVDGPLPLRVMRPLEVVARVLLVLTLMVMKMVVAMVEMELPYHNSHMLKLV